MRERSARSSAADPGAVLGMDREHEPVEEAAALAGRPAEQRVEVGRQPDEAQVFREGGGRGRRRAVDAADAARPALGRRRFEAGAEAMLAESRVDEDRGRERARSRASRHLGEIGPPQTAARPEQRQRLEQVGLAGAVLAGERDDAML